MHIHRAARGPGSFRAAAVLLFVIGLLFGHPALAQDLSSQRGRGRRIEGGGPIDLGQVAQRSTLIVRGIVSNSEPKWVGRVIYTHYDLVVQETLKGKAQNSVTVAVPGGALANVQLTVPGAPELGAGDEIVFFGQSFNASSSFKAVGIFDGIVPVQPATGDSEATVSARGRPENLEDFLNEVRALGGRP